MEPGRVKPGYIEITPEMREKLRRGFERMNLSVMGFTGRIQQGAPKPVSSTTLINWLNGKTRSAHPLLLKYVLAKLDELKDVEMPVRGRIPLTDAMREVIRQRWPQIKMAIKYQPDCPGGLNEKYLAPSRLRRQTTISAEVWQFIQSILSDQE